VLTILRCVALLSVFCVPVNEALAQDDPDEIAKVLSLGDPESLAISRHRLTADNLRRMFAVDRDLRTLMARAPDVEKRAAELEMQIDPQRRLGAVEVGAKVHEGIPEMAQILRGHKLSGREYMLTHLVAMVTAMTDDSLTDDVLRREGSTVLMTPALKFWRSMDPALKAEAAEWKKLQGYDKGLNR
jgi:hypothetical protein